MLRNKKAIATIDIETTPFAHGVAPVPLAVGVYNGRDYRDFFGLDCIQRAAEYLKELPPLILYAHNGGKFDAHFFANYLDNPIKIVNGRVLSVNLCGHVLRDSYALIPVPLAAYKKDEFDYTMLNLDVYQSNETEIKKYLRMDCIYLHELVTDFISKYGNKITIGSAAFSHLKEMENCKDIKTFETYDNNMRPFYHGGRVQLFNGGGHFNGDYSLYDVNSLYPYVMQQYRHFETDAVYHVARDNNAIDKNGILRLKKMETDLYLFAGVVDDKSDIGLLPDIDDGGKKVEYKSGVYYTLCTSHELKVALSTGMLSIVDVDIIYSQFTAGQSFSSYVQHFYNEKAACKMVGDKSGELFAKLFLNSAYGKFGQDSRKFKEYHLIDNDAMNDFLAENKEWEYLQYVTPTRSLLFKPAPTGIFNDVAIAASITGAARSVLLSGLLAADNPIYCDTDSILCKRLNGDIDDYKLGAWKNEGDFSDCYLGGKKLYALYNNGECVKKACKGVDIDGDVIKDLVINDVQYLHRLNAPNMQFSNASFMFRKIKRTS